MAAPNRVVTPTGGGPAACRPGQTWAAFAVAFGVLAAGASPSHAWLDSGELAAAGFELGVMHPPGTPGLTLLLRLSALLPMGELGFRMAAVSAALGAAAVTLVGVVLARHGARPAVRWGAAAWVLVGLTLVRQCRVVEIYALAAVLAMVVLWGFDPAIERARRTGPRLLATFAAVWAAWCFGDLRLALAPIVIAVWWHDVRRGRAWARWAPPVVVMASAVVLVLPLSSSTDPYTDWGNPETATAWWDHLQARSIREGFADEILPDSAALWWLAASAAIGRLAEDLGPPGLVLAVLALGWHGLGGVRPGRDAKPARRDRHIALALGWFVATEAFYVVGINPMGGADRQTGLVLAPVAALLVGRVVATWLAGRPRLSWGVLPLAGALLIGPPLLVSAGDLGRTRSWAPAAWTRAALAQLPPGALLLTQSDDLAAGMTYAIVVTGARPDLVTAPAQHLHKDPPGTDARRSRPWTVARDQPDERARIVAAIDDHLGRGGAVALEHAATGLFSSVPFWSDLGAVPLAIAGSEAVPVRPGPRREVEHWLPRLPAEADRERLAIALSQWARAVARIEGDFASAGATLQLVVEQVTDRHASTLVALAALRDRGGDTAGAIALTRRALSIEPGRSVALTNLALYLSRTPEGHAEALQLAQYAVELRPWRADVWERLAEVRAATGDRAGAEEAAAHARALADP